MASDESSTLYLYDVETQERFGTAEVIGSDVYFPDGVRGWSDVLDCRHPPYTEKSIAENCHFAEHVHKMYIVVTPEQLAEQTPPTED